jgi:uncharacterized membrane protein
MELETHSYGGVLPPPEILREMDAVAPGSADRAIKIAEGQATHRQELERFVIKSDQYRSWAGMIGGFIVVIVFGWIAYGLVLAGYGWTGAAFAGAHLVSLAFVFVRGSSARGRERDRKLRLVDEG